jgi:ubiquinone/menaquinone biosynthesis C-methylase UbiE
MTTILKTRSVGTDFSGSRSRRIMNLNDPTSIRADYDRIAEDYTRKVYGELEHKPFDRELLTRFVGAVNGGGTICDMGCGPGHVARFLRDAGGEVAGLDLSPQMIVQARRLNPDIPFREGNMLALELEDASLAGITAFYSIVNIPADSLPTAFREMYRVLQPEGLLLLSFHIGDEVIRPQALWSNPVGMEFYQLQPARISRLLVHAGFDVDEIIERDPYAPEVEYQSRRAYVLARKPACLAAA